MNNFASTWSKRKIFFFAFTFHTTHHTNDNTFPYKSRLGKQCTLGSTCLLTTYFTGKSHLCFILIWIYLFIIIASLLIHHSHIPRFLHSPQPLLDLDKAGLSSTSINEMSFPFSIFIPQISLHIWIDWEANQTMMMAIELIEKLAAWLTTKLTTPVTFQIWVDLSFDLLHTTLHTIHIRSGYIYNAPLSLHG